MKFLNVLNVEDSLDDSTLILRHLSKADYKVHSLRVETAEDMRAALAEEPWDVIVSDYRMPNFSGLQAYNVLQESGQDIPFIIISGTIGEETAVQAMLTGVNDYMMKNNLSRLVPAIEREMTEVRNRRAKQKAERSLRESENRLKLALIAARMGVWEWGLHDNSVFWSPECYEILGVKEFGGTFEDFANFLPPHELQRVKEALEHTIAENSFFDIEYQFNCPDGETIWVANYGMLDWNHSDTPQRLVGTVANITARKKAEDELRQSEQRFRSLTSSISQIVWTTDAGGVLQTANSPNAQLDSANDTVMTEWEERLHPQDRDIAVENFRRAIASKSPYMDEYRLLNPADSSYHYYVSRATPVFEDDGSIREWVGALTDVTERRRAEEALKESEEQLRQAQKLESVGRLAGGVAHDFNNMLTAINGYSDLTLRSLPPDDPLRGNLEEIKKAGERSAQLTRQLLAFSRQQILQERVLELNQVVIETNAMLKRVIGENYQLTSVLDQSSGKIKADPGQLSQVILNLVVNSSDAMPDGGQITIETQNVQLDDSYATQHISVSPGEYVMLAVSDTGCGIDEDTMQHIFEPFFTTKGVGKGTGLGLSTVYGIVKQSGGNIWVYSEVGNGTTFKLYFPRVEDEIKVPQPGLSSEGLQQGSETILLVEDEDLVRALSRDTLESCGYVVIEASNGVEALALIEKQEIKIDLLLTDVVMPQMGGRELAEKLLAKFPRVHVLFTSGYTDDAIVRHGIIAKGTNFIQKPFTLDALARKVRETLDTAQEG
jgi:two-component system cell cycle sensor histidine kinase/response regulator CckA